MTLFKNYSDEALVKSLLELRTAAKVNDFPVIEEVEKILAHRGHDITKAEYGPDVIGDYIKTLPGVNKRKKIRVSGVKKRR